MLAEVWLACDPVATPAEDADLMTVLFVGCALGMALCIGYQWGRRTAGRPMTWKQRTSRVALGRLAVQLAGLVVARRVQRMVVVRGAAPVIGWTALRSRNR
ncbi:hypothetical protein A5635_10200 [Mycobacterium asiaticum]|uniref:Uncharacterized protein n=2 Tax=Mycobacterium asiaticum TaxID=1790 RepID=A0A1A3UBK7_MYCAS|nr:hypothetical protein A5635_10200 [Mycobacterium asiaticum]OBK92338.1 hypothetical protein A5645_23920 [Mycobacterium asiaticum]